MTIKTIIFTVVILLLVAAFVGPILLSAGRRLSKYAKQTWRDKT